MFKTIKERLSAIYHILRYRNYILITGILEFKGQNNEPCRRLKVIQRTDYDGDSDEVSCMAAVELCKSVRLKKLNINEKVTITELDNKPAIVDELTRILKPKNETDNFNWNQIKRTINESNLNLL